jgi:tight adherence protein B
MEFSPELINIGIVILAALAAGGLVAAVFLPQLTGQAEVSKRVAQIASNGRETKTGLMDRLSEGKGEARRSKIQESLEKFEKKQQNKKKKVTLKNQIRQAGLDTPIRVFWVLSVGVGLGSAIAALIFGAQPIVALGAAIGMGLGFPRWFLKFMIKRRMESFLTLFADAIDVMVRGLKAGLPVNEAMKVIATEMDAPVGPEFTEVVQGQRVGIPLEQGVERMLDRVPLPEVNFLAIVMAIQKTTGGNLAEALDNLSVVLRDRKKMKAKVQAISQEAKASASIIGALPFVIGGGMMILNPTYLNPLFETEVGNMMLMVAGGWMTIGVLIMRKMINFKI